jgi:hypothetical protein
MACCGKARQSVMTRPASPNTHLPKARPIPRPAAARQSSVFFEYVGTTRLIVVGPVSGRRYEFHGPGSRAAVEPVDKPGVSRVPHLSQVSGPW